MWDWRPRLAVWMVVVLLFHARLSKEYKKNFMDGPPHLVSPVHDVRRVVSAGSVIHLPCPVEASDPGSLIFEWSKDRRPINFFGAGQRFRLGHRGTLKIRGTLAEDTGYYVCRAVNGFGSVEVNATLIVLADYDYDYQIADSDHHYKMSSSNHRWKDGDKRSNDLLTGSKPSFTHVSKFHRTVIQRPVGSSLLLKCFASGHPRPQVTWLKNNSTVKDASLLFSTSASKRSRWTLRLTDLSYADSGNYTCVVHNTLGSINTTFTVEITEQAHTKPEVLAFDTTNKSVEIGSTMKLTCRVRSSQMPHIQWLKGASDAENLRGGTEARQNIVKLRGESYRILKSSTETEQRQDGSFVNEFVVEETEDGDAGKYVCLAANTKGYSNRHIYVVSHQKTKPRTEAPANFSGFSEITSLYVTIPTGIGTLTGIFVVMFALFQRRRRSRPVPVKITSAATPRVQPRQLCGPPNSPYDAEGKCKSVHFQHRLDLRPFSANYGDANGSVDDGSAAVFRDDRDSPLLRRSEILTSRGSAVSGTRIEQSFVDALPVMYFRREQFGRRSEKWNHDGASEGGGMEYV